MSSSSSSREYSPDWLRNVQAPPIFTLSSSSSSSDDDDDKLPISSAILNHKSSPPKEEEVEVENSSKNNNNKRKKTLPTETLTKQDDDDDLKDLQTTDKQQQQQSGAYISSSTLPLLLSDKIQRSKVLVECQGESIDLSGDLGSVGRVVISDSPSSNQDMLFDLKGTIYKTTIIPSRTFCVVSFGQSEAKIEAIMNDFIQLKPQSNVYEAETMVEGTLEGFSFDSEDEGDKRQTDENEGADPQTNRKGRGKSEKTSDAAAAKKKGKAVVKKPPAAAKKVKKKAPVAKKAKTKK